MPVLVEKFVVVGEESDAQKAAALWRFLPNAFKGLHKIPDPAVIQREAESEIPIEKVVGSWTVGTDPAVHIEAIQKLFDSGATIVNIHTGQQDQRRAIEFYGSKVLPHFAPHH